MEKLIDEFIQTDGSLQTLQYGRQIDDFTWEYREVETMYKDTEEAINDFDNWKQDIIDLRKYEKETIQDVLQSYGYDLVSFSKTNAKEILIYMSGWEDEDKGIFFSNESVQLICECLFEQGY